MSKNKVTRILVVDDHHVVRSGLVASLGMEDDMEVVGEAESGAQALALYEKCAPDVVLMDLRMRGGNGIETTGALRAQAPEARVLMYTTFDGEEDVYRAVQAGARGYLLKSAPREELLTALRTV